MKVLRVYHSARDSNHRARERALAAAGVHLTLVSPASWPGAGEHGAVIDEPFPMVELKANRVGDVNRHSYADEARVRELIRDVEPDVIDIHEEPFSRATYQWLEAAPPRVPVVVYAAQNIDKRFPPPFSKYERRCYRRVSGLYPCSNQAAAVARGKGFAGLIKVLPLGYEPATFVPGRQSFEDSELVFAFAGRFVAEKGAADAIRIFARVNSTRRSRLVLAGSGPTELELRALASELRVGDRVEFHRWSSSAELASLFAQAHVILVPSRPTATWTEQFGRVVVEAQASGALVAGYASGAIPEVAGKPALLVRVGSEQQLADLIIDVLSDSADYEGRRAAGIASSASRTWTNVAAMQVDLYRSALNSTVCNEGRPRSPRRRRVLAESEFGPTAAATGGLRPFALPLLRRGGRLPAALGRSIDIGAEALASIGASRAGDQNESSPSVHERQR
jgi:glycosyltransferase involved in cell wall biosynthesis